MGGVGRARAVAAAAWGVLSSRAGDRGGGGGTGRRGQGASAVRDGWEASLGLEYVRDCTYYFHAPAWEPPVRLLLDLGAYARL